MKNLTDIIKNNSTNDNNSNSDINFNIKEVIDESLLFELLEKTKNPTSEKIEFILDKALKKEGLSLEDTAYLLNTNNDLKIRDNMFSVSGRIKQELYGDRLVFFAPFYLSSYCINDCSYCGFQVGNKEKRKKLSLEEVLGQVEVLVNMGHKRLLLEFGEHPKKNPIDYVVEVINTIYNAKFGKGEIRRVNVNIAATTEEDYKKLKDAGIGTYQLFQETYHRETYEKLHKKGPKSNFERQLFAHDRAMNVGLDDVGLGVLFGLYDYKFEVLSLLSHSMYLEKKYGVGPHTISVPRFQNATGVDMNLPYKVSEDELLKIISILRMAVPYTGMIISTREREEIRAKSFEIGISQTSSASKTEPGGYGKKHGLEQFITQDERCVDDTVLSVLKQGLLPSYCTACYRLNRTGETIMKLIKSGEIHSLCNPNAILTFKEYMIDYASFEVRRLGEPMIEKYLAQIKNPALLAETKKRLKNIERGMRDLYF